MKCHSLSQFGLAHLALVERPDPSPGPGEVLVRVKAVSLNYRDWLMVSGDYNPRQAMPLIPCSDGAGEVVAVGAGVARVKVGDRVMGLFSQGFLGGEPTREKVRQTLGGPLDGMLTELRVLPAESVVHVPAHLSDVEAATLPCAAVTAWNALIELGTTAPGDVILVQGTGGVSIFALQFGVMAGARVIVTSSSDAKLERARALGAWQTINYTTTPDWDKAARAMTGGVGVDHIVEVGGADTIGKSLRAIRICGTISIIGVLGGKSTDVALTPILMQHLRLQGVLVGSRDTTECMTRAITQHQLRPVVDRVFAFQEAREAFEYLAAGKHFGKVGIAV